MRQRRTAWTALAVVAMLATTFGTAAPAAAQDLTDRVAALALWDSQFNDDYVVTYSYASGSFATTDRVTVVDGVVVSSEEISGGDVIGPGQLDMTVEDIYDLLPPANPNGTTEIVLVEPSFSAQTGVPFEFIYLISSVDTTYSLRDFSFTTPVLPVNVLAPTVTCLAGNGRIDVNMVNEASTPAAYTLQIGTRTPRQQTVAAKSWWRSPVIVSANGPIDVTVLRDGVAVLNETVNVACGSNPIVSEPEVRFLTWCISGNGMVFAQIANPTASAKNYVLDVNGIRRSATAEAHGAAWRGVSGRPDGTYTATVEVAGQAIESSIIEVTCDT